MSYIVKFLIWCSGADPNSYFLQNSTNERNKYIGIGGTIIFTSILAVISSSYAFFFIFKEVIFSILFGIIWGLMIFNLDRYIISTINTSTNIYWSILPRIALALIISLVISKPLELKIFEKEINAQIQKNTNEDVKSYSDSLSKQNLIELENKLSLLNAKTHIQDSLIQNYQKELVQEIQGRVGSGLKGDGPASRQIRQIIDSLLSERRSFILQKNTYESSKDSSRVVIDGLVNSYRKERVNYYGLISKFNALSQLKSNWDIKLIDWFITLLFILIEILPIITRVLSKKSAYELSTEMNPKLIDFEKKINYEVEIEKINYEAKIKNVKNQNKYDSELSRVNTESKNNNLKLNNEQIPFGGISIYIKFNELPLNELNELLISISNIYNYIYYFNEIDKNKYQEYKFDENVFTTSLFKTNSEDIVKVHSINTGNSIEIILGSGWNFDVKSINNEIIQIVLPQSLGYLAITGFIIQMVIKYGITNFKALAEIAKINAETKKIEAETEKIIKENNILDVEFFGKILENTKNGYNISNPEIQKRCDIGLKQLLNSTIKNENIKLVTVREDEKIISNFREFEERKKVAEEKANQPQIS